MCCWSGIEAQIHAASQPSPETEWLLLAADQVLAQVRQSCSTLPPFACCPCLGAAEPLLVRQPGPHLCRRERTKSLAWSEISAQAEPLKRGSSVRMAFQILDSAGFLADLLSLKGRYPARTTHTLQ